MPELPWKKVGGQDEALDTLRQAAAMDPSDTALAAELAKAFVAKSDLAAAAEYLTPETAGNDPAPLGAEGQRRDVMIQNGHDVRTGRRGHVPDADLAGALGGRRQPGAVRGEGQADDRVRGPLEHRLALA